MDFLKIFRLDSSLIFKNFGSVTIQYRYLIYDKKIELTLKYYQPTLRYKCTKQNTSYANVKK